MDSVEIRTCEYASSSEIGNKGKTWAATEREKNVFKKKKIINIFKDQVNSTVLGLGGHARDHFEIGCKNG